MTCGKFLVATILTLAGAHAGALPPDAPALLERHCVRCHGGEKTKGGLDLTTREALLRGGETGPSVAANDPDKSLLVRSIRHQTDSEMPHKEPKLPDDAIARIADWVKAGTPYPRTLKTAAAATDTRPNTGFVLTDADKAHWAFQPVRRPPVPPIANRKSQIANPIDAFIRARLAKEGLQPSPPAPKETLLRRVTLDLTGLPPTPAELDAFLADTSADAYEKVVDRLLASPAYGERWGRHWLDLARYAETDGFEHDLVRPHAWRYRDYVIRAFNADKPYDQFVKEQIAGDELWPDDPDARVATGFNLLGPDMVDSSDQVQRRQNTLNDMTDTASLAFLGLTLGCARCHDHKFEPLSQKDYYRLQAFFTPAKFVRDLPIPTPADRAAHEAAIEAYNRQPAVRELLALEAPARESLRQKKLAKLSAEARAAHATAAEQRTAEQANLVFETEDMVKVADKDVAAAVAPADKARHQALLAAVKKLAKPAELPRAMTLALGNSNAKTFVLNRGEYTQPTDEVKPGFPVVTCGETTHGTRSAGVRTPSRRTDLANWIASPDNPLTARVMINRIWKHHFGRGLVGTPSDFGTHGQNPSHPDLLDYLAGEFVARNWSVKQMHRLMLTSATYRQSSQSQIANPQSQMADPDNRLLSRMNRLRLEGEVIRDGLLAVSGRLNQTPGGPGVFPPIPDDVAKGIKGSWNVSKDPADHCRRSVYIFARRNLRFPFLEVFDAPDSNLSCPSREKSTTAPQSLALLNADEVTTAAKALANRLTKEAATPDEQVTLAYRLALARTPSPDELSIAREFLKQSPLGEFCRALFNLNEFVYAE